MVVAHVQRRAPVTPRPILVFVGRHEDLPAVRRAAWDRSLVVLRHVARIRQRACQVAYNVLGSGFSPDITHAFPIAAALASCAFGAPATCSELTEAEEKGRPTWPSSP